MSALWFGVGVGVGALIAWLISRGYFASRMSFIQEATQRLSDTFKALSADALRDNNQSFLELAKSVLERFQTEAKGDLQLRHKAIEELVMPLKESLRDMNMQVQELERSRREGHGALSEQLRVLSGETANLARALSSPKARGCWGEIQLRRVVEMAGMLPYCDFVEQPSVAAEQVQLRPDVVIKLPNGRNVVVDAKVTLEAYMEAMDVQDEQRRLAKLKEHAQKVKEHMVRLSSKGYWEHLESPEFVVMFLPGESFFAAALEQDHALIEEGFKRHVVLATPISLIALLRVVEMGWRQERVALNAQAICDLGRELYERFKVFMEEHLNQLKKGLDSAVDAYNRAIGSLESRVLVSARRLKELGVVGAEQIQVLGPVEKATRQTQIPAHPQDQ
jgi:DNA recombination protein RmuC